MVVLWDLMGLLPSGKRLHSYEKSIVNCQLAILNSYVTNYQRVMASTMGWDKKVHYADGISEGILLRFNQDIRSWELILRWINILPWKITISNILTLWWFNIAIEKRHLFRVSFPIKHGDFPYSILVYQRVYHLSMGDSRYVQLPEGRTDQTVGCFHEIS